jgi:SAM-dependent methyltransferase
VKQAADNNPGLRALVADVRRLPFADESFDLVVSNSTLDHFASAEDIHVALRELHRVLRQGGQLILTMDNPANPAVWLRNNLPLGWLGRVGVVPYFVGATMGRRQLARALTDVGLYVHVSTAIMHCLRMPAVAVCGYLDKHASAAVGNFWTRRLAESEWLGRLPTRYVTGCFVAMDARKERPD